MRYALKAIIIAENKAAIANVILLLESSPIIFLSEVNMRSGISGSSRLRMAWL